MLLILPRRGLPSKSLGGDIRFKFICTDYGALPWTGLDDTNESRCIEGNATQSHGCRAQRKNIGQNGEPVLESIAILCDPALFITYAGGLLRALQDSDEA